MKVVGKLYAWLYLETAAGYEANYGSKLRTVINLRVLEVKTILNIHEQYVLGWSMCLHAAWTRCKCMLWRLSHLHDITEYHHRLMLHFVLSYDYKVKGGLKRSNSVGTRRHLWCVMYNNIISTLSIHHLDVWQTYLAWWHRVDHVIRIFTRFECVWTRLVEKLVLGKVQCEQDSSVFHPLVLSVYLLVLQPLVLTIPDKCSLAWAQQRCQVITPLVSLCHGYTTWSGSHSIQTFRSNFFWTFFTFCGDLLLYIILRM